VKTPTLNFSDSRDMCEHITIDPQLLFTLANDKGGFQRFLTEIHSSIENGSSINDVQNQLRSQRFVRPETRLCGSQGAYIL
jgi:hypothetical protein